ncbi:hypothetical protein BV22DRAFT_122373 [Leucogyrophana mollusca]|uniref:Uncharacterized protein n=1 Tax=Leucogyrophana mollusca TaxID=85980 RepID=A0ACB8BXI7_9AGAM|nr:hypothetical protein BV22DRAFT_122373 [Leucogyrophana mollusca]
MTHPPMCSSSPSHNAYHREIHGAIVTGPESCIDPRRTLRTHASLDCTCSRFSESYDFLMPPGSSATDILAAAAHRDLTPVPRIVELNRSPPPPRPSHLQVPVARPHHAPRMCQGVWIDEQELQTAHANAPDGKVGVYKCLWDSKGSGSCNLWVEGVRKSMARHLQEWHGISSCDHHDTCCLWDGCGRVLKGENIARHILGGSHIDAKVMCSTCGLPLSRGDAFTRHIEKPGPCSGAHSAPLAGANCHVIHSCTAFEPHRH